MSNMLTLNQLIAGTCTSCSFSNMIAPNGATFSAFTSCDVANVNAGAYTIQTFTNTSISNLIGGGFAITGGATTNSIFSNIILTTGAFSIILGGVATVTNCVFSRLMGENTPGFSFVITAQVNSCTFNQLVGTLTGCTIASVNCSYDCCQIPSMTCTGSNNTFTACAFYNGTAVVDSGSRNNFAGCWISGGINAAAATRPIIYSCNIGTAGAPLGINTPAAGVNTPLAVGNRATPLNNCNTGTMTAVAEFNSFTV